MPPLVFMGWHNFKNPLYPYGNLISQLKNMPSAFSLCSKGVMPRPAQQKCSTRPNKQDASSLADPTLDSQCSRGKRQNTLKTPVPLVHVAHSQAGLAMRPRRRRQGCCQCCVSVTQPCLDWAVSHPVAWPLLCGDLHRLSPDLWPVSTVVRSSQVDDSGESGRWQRCVSDGRG